MTVHHDRPDEQDVVDLLRRQHAHIRDLFGAVTRAEDTAGRQEAFAALRRFLAVHETAEELVTHPTARMAQGGNTVVDARLQEEDEAKEMLAELDGMSVDEPRFHEKLTALRKAVLEHAQAEEQLEFPLLRLDNDEETLRRMAAAVRAAEALAPTHPHPSVGSSMTANLVAGPIASLVDRTRDAVNAALRG
jgi:hemerythrin superfamily protein